MSGPVRRVLASARARILLTLFCVLAFMAVLTTVLLREVLEARATERVDDNLTQEVAEFRRLVKDGRNPNTGKLFGRDVEAMFDVFLERNVPGRGELIYTFLPDGPYRRSQTDLPQPVIERLIGIGTGVADTRRGEVETPDQQVHYLAVPVEAAGEQRGVFLIAGDLSEEQAAARDAADVAAYVAGVALVLATLLGLVVTGRTLRPLREMAGTAQAITESDLTRRLDIRSDDEIGQLARTFNQMLDRLELAFDSQRSLVSDVGHELRTPITIVRGHLDLLSEDDPAERAETIALVQDELDRMSRLVNDLLTLAKAERTDFLHPELLDLDDLTAALFAKARGLGDEHDWQLSATGTGTLVADRQRLTQAVMNLADNARRYTPPGGRIVLATRIDGREARLSVADDGPGIALADQERLFGRFARGADAPSGEGSGLGLAIVRAIAEAHGGRVELHSVPGHGAMFTVVLPAEPVPEPEPLEAVA